MPRRFFLAALLALTGFISLSAFAKPTPAEWKKLEADAQRAFATSDSSARIEAVKALGGADCLDGVKLLVQLLNSPDRALAAAEAARDAYEPEYATALERIVKFAKQGNGQVAVNELELFQKKERQMDDLNQKVQDLSAVPDAIGEALAKTHDLEGVKFLVGDGMKDKSWRTRAVVAYAIGFAPAENATANPALQGALADKDGRVRSAAIEALARRGAKEAGPAIIAALDDERWQVRVSAAEALGKLQLRDSVAPLIDRMQKEDGRVKEDIDSALKAITGLSFRADALGWKGWWELNKADWESGKLVKKEEKKDDPAGAKPDGGPDPAPGGTTVTFYGIETKSKNLIFVVDISGSMAEPAGDPPPTDSGQPAGQGPKGKRKIDVARYELSKAIGQLPEDARFNIITFSSDVRVYSPLKMIVATKANKTQAQKFAETLEPEASTNIYDALEKAFQIAGGGGQQVDENYKLSVDTIFFMTDGEPTTGKSKDPKVIGDTVQKWNAVRKIRIHCIGIGKCAEELLKRLAADSGGTYVKR